ncbi:IclR family transcriptional regulator [Microbacterium sp. RD1]|uniref:IclR family transcriptional regulator n=1 Tax=Microbacterium sp. RD1 TaxID=3457313 RepID=UPI003FA5A0F9
MASSSGYREKNSTADRALNILQMFGDERPEVSAVEVAEMLAVARSTAYRYLQTLVQSQFLVDTGRGTFRLGLKILELSRIARGGLKLADLAVPRMKQLADLHQQTVLLTKQMGPAVICLEREESRTQYVRLSYERGSVLNLNAGASALVLFAWLPEEEVRRLVAGASLTKFTAKTLTDPDAIVSRLAEIRREGVAVTDGEVDLTAMGIAAPIFNGAGVVVAALSIVLIRSLVPAENIPGIVKSVAAAARDLSNEAALLDR